EFRKYNYALNEHKNSSINPKRVSVVADLIKQNATILNFEDLRRTDVVLYYISLIFPTNTPYKEKWYPETSCYNPYNFDILPKIISKRYFEKIKVLFAVENVNELKIKIDNIIEQDNVGGFHKVPHIKNGLNYDQ